MKENKNFKRIVVKFGTQNLTSKGWLDQSIFNDAARQIVDLLVAGIEVVVITSGAVQAGRERLKLLHIKPEEGDLEKKDIAGIGMRHLLSKWGVAFHRYGYEIAQVLVTHANWKNKGERKSIRKAILNYAKCGFMPVINENDAVSDREIKSWENKISENDQLARMVAELIGANAILFLTDVGGIFDKNPQDLSARMYSVININALPPELLKISKTTSANGTGGMEAKLKWASDCVRDGMYTVIAGLKEEDSIFKFACREPVGTLLADSGENILKI